MAYRLVTGSRGTWNTGRTSTLVPPANGNTTASVIEGVNPYRFLGINATEQLSVAVPQYTYYSQPNDFNAIGLSVPTRPVQNGDTFQSGDAIVHAWEPDLYWGKPGTIITRPKTCLILVDGNVGVSFGFGFENAIAAITSVVADSANENGIHIYLLNSANTGGSNLLIHGLLAGETTVNIDLSMTPTLPIRFPIGDLLILSFAYSPAGWGQLRTDLAYINSPVSPYPEAGVYTTGLNYAGDEMTPLNYGYFAATSTTSHNLPAMLAYDQALMADYESEFSFRHVFHPIGGSLPLLWIIDITTDPVGYTATIPSGFPSSPADYFSQMVGTLNNYRLGATIDYEDYPSTFAAAILAEIEDYFGI